jgi:hypothetical protein
MVDTSGSLLTAIEQGLQQFFELIASYRVSRFRLATDSVLPFPNLVPGGFITIPAVHAVASLDRSRVALKG